MFTDPKSAVAFVAKRDLQQDIFRLTLMQCTNILKLNVRYVTRRCGEIVSLII